jgi:hypothetical protein
MTELSFREQKSEVGVAEWVWEYYTGFHSTYEKIRLGRKPHTITGRTHLFDDLEMTLYVSVYTRVQPVDQLRRSMNNRTAKLC